MGFLCINKDSEKNVNFSELNNQEFLRDIGLDAVNNIKTDVIVCSEVFIPPQYYVTGVTDLVTGITSNITGCTTGMTGIYNTTYTPDFNITFFLTGDTTYTGYTGEFCYKVFSDKNFVDQPPVRGIINGSEVLNKCINFSAITSNTITETFSEGVLPRIWSQYMIRPYYTFITKECSPGNYFNQWDSTLQLNIFNNDTDFYFMTVLDPPEPVLQVGENSDIQTNYDFIQDILLNNGVTGPLAQQATVNNVINYFILRTIPSNSVMVFLNGVKLTENTDYRLIIESLNRPPIVEFFGEIKITDVIVANYIAGLPTSYVSSDFNRWYVKNILVNNITIDANVGYTDQVNVNSITGNYEIYIDQTIDNQSDLILFINGVEMVYNQQFFLSTSRDNRIILDKTYIDPIKIGDIISIFGVSPYIKVNDYGSLKTNVFEPTWLANTSLQEGLTEPKFIVQVALKDDINYNNILYEKTVPFVVGNNLYTTQISNISLGFYYRFRIIYEVTYNAFLDNKIKTCSSTEGFFDTSSRYVNNTY
jgi:hypothetical protein